MKKMKVLLVGILTLIMSFMCFSGCALFKVGKYKATSIEVLGVAQDISSEDAPYVDLKLGGTAVVFIKAGSVSYDGEYKWEEVGEDTIKLSKDGEDGFELTVKDGELIFDFLLVKIVFEK